MWPFLAASLVAGIGAGLLNPAQSAAVADVVGAKSNGGPVLAGFQMAADVGAILGPLITGVLADAVSYQAAFAVTDLSRNSFSTRSSARRACARSCPRERD